MFSIRSLTPAFSLVALAGCGAGQHPPPETLYRTAPVIVATGCVADRPEPVTPLKNTAMAARWAQMPTGAKARAIEAQAGLRMNHADKLAAATAGCK